MTKNKADRVCCVYLLRIYSATAINTEANLNKVYIGSSVDVNSRIKAHTRMLVQGKHHSYKLQKFFNKTPDPVLEIIVLEICEPSELSKIELKYIMHFNSVRKGFNVTYDVRRQKA